MNSNQALLGSALVILFFIQLAVAVPPFLFDGYGSEDFPLEGPSDGGAAAVNAAVERGDLSVDQLLHGMNKRSCIRRGGRCDHRPDDCCSGGACRCNLWGTNCQCQRMGIFQKWG